MRHAARDRWLPVLRGFVFGSQVLAIPMILIMVLIGTSDGQAAWTIILFLGPIQVACALGAVTGLVWASLPYEGRFLRGVLIVSAALNLLLLWIIHREWGQALFVI